MELKKLSLLAFFLIVMGVMLGACSEKSFNASDESVFQQCLAARPEVKCVQVCDESGTCIENYDYVVDTEAQAKDILFVVDVSGSMSDEQARMGSMFPNFINILANVDYRIAITTTDVRDTFDIRDNTNLPDVVNGHGAFQDGELIPFNDNSYFLDGSLPLLTEQRFFEETIMWNQTLTCERNNYVEAHCPSGDERGILAAAMTFEKNPSDFIRSTGHMAVVILSDEDEGAGGNVINSIAEPNREQPDRFIDYFKVHFPYKSLSVHSIIVQPKNLVDRSEIQSNGETRCFNAQDNNNAPDGKYGFVYAELSRLTEGGVVGDICANDQNYTEQIEEIGASVSVFRDVLACSPNNGEVDVELIPDPGYEIELIKNLSQNEILFAEPLPSGTKVRVRYSCTTN